MTHNRHEYTVVSVLVAVVWGFGAHNRLFCFVYGSDGPKIEGAYKLGGGHIRESLLHFTNLY